MLFESLLAPVISGIIKDLTGKDIGADKLVFQPTRKEFEGDITLVVFPLAKQLGLSPDETGKQIGEALINLKREVSDFNLIKGFLNLVIRNELWLNELSSAVTSGKYGFKPVQKDKGPVLVEYSSPNTNKPLHLGHIRNNLLGFSVGEILKANGIPVVKVNIVNDRGIHICKSMVAWKNFGAGETPEQAQLKGDHLVGKYYVVFDKENKKQVDELTGKGLSKEEAEKQTLLIQEAQEMLRKWEAGDKDTLALWSKMNQWVYDGFDVTYKRLGVDFDKIYYESETYLLGKEIIEKGLAEGVLYKKPDNSVWIDLTNEGLDEKLLLRADGTSVYMTQDLGTAEARFHHYNFKKMIYVVGNEQEYHFKVLFLVLKKLGYEWADRLFHLSYNMVDLPSGKMKSREGTVVDADELMDDMVAEAKKLTTELGKIDELDSPEAFQLFEMIGLGALKYFILKVDPEKRMLFNPNESIDFNGNTGPFIQYTHARLKSVLRKASSMQEFNNFESTSVENFDGMIPKEKELVKNIVRFPQVIEEAGQRFSPALIANYAFDLSKSFNQFYHDHAIIDPASPATTAFRLQLCNITAKVIASSMGLLGISVPEKM